jgi:hypothetical protein
MSPDLYSPLRPQSIGEVLDSAFRIFKLSGLKCLPYGVATMLAGQIPNIYELALRRPLKQFGGGDPAWWVLFVVGVVLSMLLWCAQILRQRALIQNQPVAAAAELGLAWRRLPAILACAVLVPAALCVGFALLVLPGLYLLLAFTLCAPPIVFSGMGPIAAMRYGVRLIYGNWWRAFTIYAVGFSAILVFYVLSFMLVAVLLPFAGSGDVAAVTAFSAVLVVILGAIAMPFLSALTLAVYTDLQRRREEDVREAAPEQAAVPERAD